MFKWCFIVIFLNTVHDVSGMSHGQRFMTDLLVSSLMSDGGLESALEAAIKYECQDLEDWKVGRISNNIIFIIYMYKLQMQL